MKTATIVVPLRGPDLRIDSFALDLQKTLVNVEAEHGLLGAIMMDNRCYDAVSDFLYFEDFCYPLHQRIYAAIASLIGGGQRANPVTLNAFFDDDELLKYNGGSNYLVMLARSAVTLVNSYFYGKTISDLARRRQVIDAAVAVINDAGAPTPDRAVSDVIEGLEQRLYEIAETGQHHPPRPVAEVAREVVAETKQAQEAGGAIVVDTGLADLDDILKGMGAGDLAVLAGRPSMGKSACAGSIAVNVAKAGKRPMIFTLEMTGADLGRRWLAGHSGITTEKLRHGNLDMTEWPRLYDAEAEISRLPITIDDQPRLSAATIRQRARRQKRRGGLDLIIIDHLQLMRQGGKQESRRLEIGDVTSGLKSIAKELEVPVLLLSQLNRKVEDRDDKRPTLSDLKESGDIEQDADVVMFLFREHYYLAKTEPRQRGNDTKDGYTARLADWQEDCNRLENVAELIVAKNRHGRTGTVKLSFNAARQRFANFTARELP